MEKEKSKINQGYLMMISFFCYFCSILHLIERKTQNYFYFQKRLSFSLQFFPPNLKVSSANKLTAFWFPCWKVFCEFTRLNSALLGINHRVQQIMKKVERLYETKISFHKAWWDIYEAPLYFEKYFQSTSLFGWIPSVFAKFNLRSIL